MEGIQTSLFDDVPRFKIKNKVRLIELFAGIGSQAKSLERLGVDFEHYRVCEFDRYAVRSYNAIHGTNFEPSDIRRWKGADLGIEDTDQYSYILTYSFPCTDLSVAGKMQGMSRNSGTRSGLLWEVERLLKETDTLPQVLLMENVPQVCGGQNIRDFEEWLKFLEKLGYANFYKILNAKDYGVPQNRERCYMVSLLGDYWYDFPKPKKLNVVAADILEKKVEEKYILNFSYTDIKEDREKNSSRCIQVRQLRHRGFNEMTGRVYSQHGLLPTLLTLSGGNHQIKIKCDVGNRRLTELEYWRGMGFDDIDFFRAKAAGLSSTRLYNQAGNSIVVAVLEEIFKQLV